ncbi:Chorismate pyruvate-lyase [compost metagenome]
MLDVCKERTIAWRGERDWRGHEDAWSWLSRQGSLTAHLRALGEVEVEVLFEQLIRLGPYASVLGRNRELNVWSRDVVLRVDGRPAVVARTLVEEFASKTSWRKVKDLRQTPLATILYADARVRRSDFQYGFLGRSHRLYRLARRVDPGLAENRLWARRSVFERNRTKLAVAECFMPWVYGCHRVRAR